MLRPTRRPSSSLQLEWAPRACNLTDLSYLLCSMCCLIWNTLRVKPRCTVWTKTGCGLVMTAHTKFRAGLFNGIEWDCHFLNYVCVKYIFEGRDSSVGIATRYVLDGLGIESRWGGARFPAPIQTSPGTHPPSYTMHIGCLSRG